jgi:hypothetical protein
MKLSHKLLTLVACVATGLFVASQVKADDEDYGQRAKSVLEEDEDTPLWTVDNNPYAHAKDDEDDDNGDDDDLKYSK